MCQSSWAASDEATQTRWWLAGGVVHAAQGPRSWRLCKAVEGDAHKKRLQDLRPGHGRPGRRHGQRGRPLSRSLQEIVAGHGRRHAGRHPPEFFETYSLAQLQAFSPASWNPAGGLPRRWFSSRRAILPPIAWDDALGGSMRQAGKHHAATRSSGIPAAAARTRRDFCCSCWPGCTARTTSTIAGTIATRPAASAWRRARHGHRHDSLDDLEGADCVSHRRQSGQQSSAADAALMQLRRRGGHVIVINPVKEIGAGQFPRAQRRAQPAVRHRRSPACMCSRTSAATSHC